MNFSCHEATPIPAYRVTTQKLPVAMRSCELCNCHVGRCQLTSDTSHRPTLEMFVRHRLRPHCRHFTQQMYGTIRHLPRLLIPEGQKTTPEAVKQ